MSVAQSIKNKSRNENHLISLCQQKSVKIEYLPLVTNKYIFKDGSNLILSRKNVKIG